MIGGRGGWGDDWYPDPEDITAHPKPIIDRSNPTHDRAVRGFRKALRKRAARDTKRALKRMSKYGIASTTQVVWGREAQDAYLDVGWVPVSEAPRNEGFTKMTMRLDA